jgi:hypothetical protein
LFSGAAVPVFSILKTMQLACRAEARMETVSSALHGIPGAGETAEKSPVTIGYFKIKPSDGRVIFELKGDFNRDNIKGIGRAITCSQALHRKFFELDMSRVASIDMQAMTLLIISLKALRDRGTEGSVTGLAGGNRVLAYELGMQHVSRIV